MAKRPTKGTTGTEPDQQPTEDVNTHDVVSEHDDTKPDTENPLRSPRRVRLPSKAEIIAAVEGTTTENLEVDPLTKESAQTPTVEDVD